MMRARAESSRATPVGLPDPARKNIRHRVFTFPAPLLFTCRRPSPFEAMVMAAAAVERIAMATAVAWAMAWAVACLAPISLAAAQEARPAAKQPTMIPAQRLGPALQQLARDRNVQLVYRSELVGDRQTGGATGELTFEEALSRLLEGTGLTFRYLDEKAITIVPLAKSTSRGDRHDNPRLWERLRVAQLGKARTAPAATQAQLQPQHLSGESASSPTVEEIIVTAQKRSERLQDVPVSVAVLGADEISRRGLVDSEDYLRGLPGVNQAEGVPAGQAIIIRGLETTVFSQNYFAGPTTATYFGETPTTNSAGLHGSSVDIKLVDIERVEILRGPQGTAFGHSAMGGAVRIIPVAPKLDRFDGRVAAGYSLTGGAGGENHMLQAMGNIPLVEDKLALRATAYKFDDSGYYRNRAGSDAAYQSSFVIPYGVSAFAIDEDEVGEYRVRGARISALFQPNEDLKLTVGYLTQRTETDGLPLQTSGDYEQTLLRVAPEHVRRGETAGVNDFELQIASAVIEYDFGWSGLLAMYSHTEAHAVTSAPYGPQGLFSLAWAASALRDFPHRNDVGEIRLVGKLEGAWNFLVGAYLEQQYNAQLLDITWFGDQATNPFGQRNGILAEYNRRRLRQKAGFAEVSWALLPKLTLTGGVRHFGYDRVNRTTQSGPLIGNVTNGLREASQESGETFRLNLTFKPSSDAMLYAGWAQGFRLGQPLAQVPSGVCDVDPADGIIDGTDIPLASTSSLKSDTVDSYELGTKLTLAQRRMTLEAAVFRMEWDDIPVAEILPCRWNHFFNAGSARSQGVELQTRIRVSDALRVDLGGSYIKAELTQDVPAQGYSAGDRLPGAPKVNGSLGVHYDFDLLGHAAFVRGDASYVGTFYSEVIQTPDSRAGDYIKVNATAGVNIGRLSADLYVHNLTGEDAYTNRVSVPAELKGYRMRPRTIGLQLGYSF
jgi:iron complex outermembrane receptor protein